MILRGSIVLSPEDAQTLFAAINHTNGTIKWGNVASDIGTTVEEAYNTPHISVYLPPLTHFVAKGDIRES
jgi:hypothetical protein